MSCLADIDDKAAKAAAERLAAEQIKAVPVRCDVSERAGVREAALEAVAAFGKIHIVCNNAGVAVGGMIGTSPSAIGIGSSTSISKASSTGRRPSCR